MFSYFWHRILRRPFELKVVNRRTVKKPRYHVIFLHGIAATSHTWRQTFNLVKKEESLADLQLLNCDLLGYGKAATKDWMKYDYTEYIEALLQTVKKLESGVPVILIGHSMGALIAARFAKKYPDLVQMAILVSPPVLLPEEIAGLPDKFYLKTYRKADQLIEKPPLSTLAPFIEKVSAFRSKYTKTPAFARSMENIVLNNDNFATFCELEVPGVIIHGRVDPLVYGPNLARVVKKNENLQLLCTIGHHDINSVKRQKILKILKEVTK